MAKNFSELLSRLSTCDKKTLSVACAHDKAVLEAVNEAYEKGIADSILVGDEAKMREIASEIGMDLSHFTIINETDEKVAPLTAVQLVHDGKADMYMKGLLPTKDFLKSVLNKEVYHSQECVTVHIIQFTNLTNILISKPERNTKSTQNLKKSVVFANQVTHFIRRFVDSGSIHIQNIVHSSNSGCKIIYKNQSCQYLLLGIFHLYKDEENRRKNLISYINFPNSD